MPFNEAKDIVPKGQPKDRRHDLPGKAAHFIPDLTDIPNQDKSCEYQESKQHPWDELS
jgi:hypothetical protein